MTIRITWNSNTIDLLVGPEGLDTKYIQEREQQKAGSGLIETINHYSIIEGFLDTYFLEATYHSLLAWWSWADQGRPFSVAFDTAKDSSTDLDGDAAAGQKVIPLIDTTGFSAGDMCLIRSWDRFTFEIVEIDSVSAGVSVTAKTNLLNSYLNGDYFRHRDYFPAVICLDEEFRPKKRGTFYSHTFHFCEEADITHTVTATVEETVLPDEDVSSSGDGWYSGDPSFAKIDELVAEPNDTDTCMYTDYGADGYWLIGLQPVIGATGTYDISLQVRAFRLSGAPCIEFKIQYGGADKTTSKIIGDDVPWTGGNNVKVNYTLAWTGVSLSATELLALQVYTHWYGSGYTGGIAAMQLDIATA